MSRNVLWDDKRKDLLKRLLEQGKSYAELGRLFSVKPSTIRVYVHEFGFSSMDAVAKNKHYSTTQRKKVLKLASVGMSVAKIAHETDVGRSTIYKWLQREKLKATQG